jgi:serine protease Do
MKSHPLGYLLFGLLTLSPVLRGEAQTTPPANPSAPAPALTTPQGKVPPPPGTVDIASEPTVKVVANVLPAVVNITAQETVPEYVTAYDQYFRLYRGVRNQTQQSIGSGLIISADGYILTNAHVVALAERDKEVSITLSSGSKYQAQIITADDDQDLALLKIEDRTVQFPYFDLTYTSPNLLGETVIALGSPAGYQNSVSQGILSAKGRTFTVQDPESHEDHVYKNLIQTDAAINPGNSGGPLVDMNGGLVGINSAKLAGEAIQSIGFAIPHEIVIPWANDAMAVAKGLKPAPAPAITAVQVLHDRLGLTVEPLSADKAAEMNLPLAGGLLITHVDDDTPAAGAGLRDGMIVVAVGSRQIVDEKSLPRELLRLGAGEQVRLQVIYLTTLGPLTIQRGGAVMLTAR